MIEILLRSFCVQQVTGLFRISVLLIAFSSSVFAADVLVTTGEVRGQGVLKKRANECLVITPAHVVAEADFSDIILTLPDRREVRAEILEVFDNDLAILRPQAGQIKRCKQEPFENAASAAILNSFDKGTLRRLDSTGDTALFGVLIDGFDTYKSVRVVPKSADRPIKQGYSGSLLYIDRKLMGMLLNVNADSGVGFVIQGKTIKSTLDPFFSAAISANKIHIVTGSDSKYLVPSIQEEAKGANWSLVKVDWDVQLTLNTVRTVIDSDTDFLVKYETSLVVVDKSSNTVLSKKLGITGNSFVSNKKAEENARVQMIDQYRALEFFDQIQ